MLKKSFLSILVIGALAAGCSSVSILETPVDTATATIPLPTEIPLETVTEIPEPTDTAVPEPTEAEVIQILEGEGDLCVAIGDHDPLPEVDYASYPAAILEYLNQGASPEELAVELIVRGLGPSEQPVRTDDLTGDGYRDVVVSIYDLQVVPQGGMLIYTCADNQYVLSYISLAGETEQAPEALLIQDLNADQQPELVFSTTNCGAHTCFEEIEILSWVDGAFSERVEGSTADLPNPSAQLTDYDQNAIYALEVVGTAIASVGAGPQRDETRVWEYDPSDGFWKYASDSLAASPFRIHLVHDADDAMLRGEYQIAALLFSQVVEDEDLLDWLNPTEEALDLGAYSYFKRVVAAGFLAQIQSGEALLVEMRELYTGTDQDAYLEMAEAFWAAFTSTGVAENGCEAAQQYAALNQAAVLSPLGSETYGYANRDYGPMDICP